MPYLIFLCSFLAVTNAQNINKDAALWANVYLEKKINKKLNVHLNHKSRIQYNMSEYQLGYADLGITYKFTKNIKVLADYVFAQRRRKDNTCSTRHQGYIALVVKKEIKNFTVSYRNMLQSQVRDAFLSDDGRLPVWYDRNKLTLKYKLDKRYSFYVAEELYLPLYQARIPGLDRSRSFAGMFYNLTKKNALEFYFAYQRELRAKNETDVIFIYGIGFEHTF